MQPRSMGISQYLQHVLKTSTPWDASIPDHVHSCLSANPFSCWMRFFHTQCQPFFMLDEFHLSLPLKRDHTKLVPEVLELCIRQWLGEHILNLILGSHELEPHCSPMYHIPDIVVNDLNMLRPVMEH
jgi:hypothetical protein